LEVDQPFALGGVGRGGLTSEGNRDFFAIGSGAPNGKFDVPLKDCAWGEEWVWKDIRPHRFRRRSVHEHRSQWNGEAVHGGADGSGWRKHGR
jgi:hypothetical protein